MTNLIAYATYNNKIVNVYSDSAAFGDMNEKNVKLEIIFNGKSIELDKRYFNNLSELTSV